PSAASQDRQRQGRPPGAGGGLGQALHLSHGGVEPMTAVQATGKAVAGALGTPLAEVLLETRRLLGAAAYDVPAGIKVADMLRIGRVVEAAGDENPLFLDPNHGAQSWWRTVIAPPSFVLAVQGPESRGALPEGAR